MQMFVAGRTDWFTDHPDERGGMGGKFETFIFCRGEHLMILTTPYLTKLMEDAGFANARTCLPTRKSSSPALLKDCLRVEWESNVSSSHPCLRSNETDGLVIRGSRVQRV